MADFCHACSMDMFNEDYRDLAGLCQPGSEVEVLCENCGNITVDHEGKRVAKVPNYNHSAFPGSPWEQGNAREKALAEGLRRLAFKYQVTFKEPLQINSLGEINLFLVAGQTYGESFAALLCRHSPRTGISPTKFLDPANSWCMMNHFNVQRMLEEAGV